MDAIKFHNILEEAQYCAHAERWPEARNLVRLALVLLDAQIERKGTACEPN